MTELITVFHKHSSQGNQPAAFLLVNPDRPAVVRTEFRRSLRSATIMKCGLQRPVRWRRSPTWSVSKLRQVIAPASLALRKHHLISSVSTPFTKIKMLPSHKPGFMLRLNPFGRKDDNVRRSSGGEEGRCRGRNSR